VARRGARDAHLRAAAGMDRVAGAPAIGVELARRRDAIRARRIERVLDVLRGRRAGLQDGSPERTRLERRIEDFDRELDSVRSRLPTSPPD
jgi:hypothetical protein